MNREEFLRIARESNKDLGKLRVIQEKIAKKIILKDDFPTPIKYIGGVDSAYIDDIVITACIILTWPKLELINQKCIISETKFPYLSTFFAFREGPPILEVLSSCERMPDILMINSHGILHPIFAGCASHIGVLLNLPTIGVAQNALCGEWESEPASVGEWVPIIYQNKMVGAYYLSQKESKPIFISPGHRITLETAVEFVKNSIKNHRMPEPLYLAHQQANEKKRNLIKK
ncbi:MAG: endonuclease V [Candidatus Helarchaeota archaeon]